MSSTKDEIIDRLVAKQQHDEQATADAVARREANRTSREATVAATRAQIEADGRRYMTLWAALNEHQEAFVQTLAELHDIARKIRAEAASIDPALQPLEMFAQSIDMRLARLWGDSMKRLGYVSTFGGLEFASSLELDAGTPWAAVEQKAVGAALHQLATGEQPEPARVKHRSTPQPHVETKLTTTYKFDR